ncbi:MAG TPA: ATP-dependent RecD-like DNA helicase [Clostridiales bacterium]|nr:ATP-dependent RecD-like DNA helicase [Clostridiales bacterium]
MQENQSISGVIERITFINHENGYTVAKMKSKGYNDLITIVGNMPNVSAGAVVLLKGEWKVDSKYGRQFAVKSYEERLPATAAGIEKYLGSGLIKGIGPVNAKRIVRMFKEDTLRIIEEDTEQLLKVEGIGPKRVEMIKKAWEEQKEVKNIMLFLQSHGVSTAYGVKIYKFYGSNSIQVVRENPYRLADDIWGIGFKTADRIAANMGFDTQSYERIRSGILYVLNQMSNEGHCFAYRDQLAEEAGKLLEAEPELIQKAVGTMLEEGSLIADDEDALFLPAFYHSEVGVARRLKKIMETDSIFIHNAVDNLVNYIERKNNIKYNEMQRKAIINAGSGKLMVLTGGPGTGKTFTTMGILSLFQLLNARILLAAPTGRAAKRMSEVTGMEAKTIHRLLEYNPSKGYTFNEDNPLKCDVLIVDEVSMVDLILMYNLLKAVPDEAVVILVGDVDQLPSVGAGNVLRDIIDSERVEVVRLTEIYRQAQGSMIITNAHRVNQGKALRYIGPKDRDFFFIEGEDPDKIAQTIVSLVTERMPKYYKIDPVRDIQVLCPMLKGSTGAHNINQLLQDKLSGKEQSVRYGGSTYYLGDKVMQVKNNYDKNVFNGDIGFIEEIDPEDRVVRISFDDKSVEYDYTELDEIILAYASTVHKSQGSEYPVVIAPFTTQHYMMLQRNLLYTCITRAKRVFVLVGTKKAVAMAVNNNKIAKRNTMLAKRIRAADAG